MKHCASADRRMPVDQLTQESIDGLSNVDRSMLSQVDRGDPLPLS